MSQQSHPRNLIPFSLIHLKHGTKTNLMTFLPSEWRVFVRYTKPQAKDSFYLFIDYGSKTEIFHCLWEDPLNQTFYCHDDPKIIFSVQQLQGHHMMFIPVDNQDNEAPPYSLNTSIDEFLTPQSPNGRLGQCLESKIFRKRTSLG